MKMIRKFMNIQIFVAAVLLLNLPQVCSHGERLDNDIVFNRLVSDKKKTETKRAAHQSRSLIRNPEDRQADAWNLINTFESYKKDSVYEVAGSDGRKIFSSFHYIVLPIYWNGKTWDHMDMENISTMLDMTVQNFASQSFGKLDLTYELLPQTELPVSSTNSLTQAMRYSETIIKNMTDYDKGTDYDGIMVVYHPLGGSGDLCCRAGKAFVGGSFMVVSYTDIDTMYRLTRHEVGHNFGHMHHPHNHYNYRDSRPYPANMMDGFDFMSGGNKFDRSDFGLFSKWFYNWVSDKSIIPMQPEGQTVECPSCLDSGTFTLKTFDNWSYLPRDNDILGVQIPIAKVHNEEWGTDLLYSYWLSYRTGVGGHLKDGLQIHLVWFEVSTDYETVAGAWFDSMNYDAFGHTDDKSDSVVLENSCYHVSPSPYMLDLDFISANVVQPVICVDSVNELSDITVSISFLNPETPPSPLPNVIEHSISCRTDSTHTESFNMNSKEPNMIHMKGLGDGGSVTMSSFASHQGWDTAYFYDGYPYSPLVYGSDASYGSMKRLTTGNILDCNDGNCGKESGSLTYTSLFGEIFIVVAAMPWATDGDRVVVTISCKAQNCMRNEYLENGRCTSCPPHHIANGGATSRSQCQMCPSGTHLSHPYAPECSRGYREMPPTDPPTKAPVGAPTKKPTLRPTPKPTPKPTLSPTMRPTPRPTTAQPTLKPTISPTLAPVVNPSPVSTSFPTLSPVISTNPPTKSKPDCSDSSECTENSDSVFFLRRNLSNEIVTRDCAWLTGRASTVLERICQMDIKRSDFHSAKYVCFETCDSCGLFCNNDDDGNRADDPTAKFLKGMKRKRNGEMRKVVKTCAWLAGKSESIKIKLCRKTRAKDGFEPANMVCPVTCFE